MEGDFSLSFIADLGESPSDEHVDRAWQNRIFPLLCTADCETNWRVLADREGLFVTSSGTRCRVEPRPHHATRFSNRDIPGAECRSPFLYEALVFAKVTYQLWSNERRQVAKAPSQVDRRLFMNRFVSKLPVRWRTLIVHFDLHLYNDHAFPDLRVSGSDLYRPLKSPLNTRLITLLPNKNFAAPIECTVDEAELGSGQEYEALSYVWGDRSSPRSIVLNGKAIEVTVNLEAAIRHLRPREGLPRIIWIDALCINQSDVAERTEQVARMDNIYRQAGRVIIWLGRESNTSALAFKSLIAAKEFMQGREKLFYSQYFLNFPFQHEPYCPECDGVPHEMPKGLAPALSHVRGMNEIVQHARDPDSIPQEWKNRLIEGTEALVNVLDRPWWRRVWVLQEVILAHNVTVQCGAQIIDWAAFQAILYTTIRQAKRRRAHQFGYSPEGSLRATLVNESLLSKATNTFAFFCLQHKSNFYEQVGTLSMANLLSLTGSFEATDPRDKIFGLLGLLPPHSPERLAFRPDYTANTRRLFIQIAKHFISTTQKLDVITARPPLPHYDVFQPQGQGTPSWVADWSLPQCWPLNSIWISAFSELSTLHLYMKHSSRKHEHDTDVTDQNHMAGDTLQVFNASYYDRSPFPFQFSAFDEILQGRGITVDTIEEVGSPWDLFMSSGQSSGHVERHIPQERAYQRQSTIIESWKSVARVTGEESYPCRGQTRAEAFWRTIFLNRERSIGGSNSVFSINRIPADLSAKSPIQPPSELSGSYNGASVTMRGLKMEFPPSSAESEEELLAYLQHEVNETWSFGRLNLHCSNLCMFRTTKGYIGLSHPNTKSGDKVVVLLGAAVPMVLREYAEGHILIGQSYVHGIMDGEIIQIEISEGRGREPWDFELFDII
ncbi:heterokaryon incompatibility protein-domain-containing protein [Aspergillus bertholletiae]|uniref:Heterokaryon incompatibility protein-domain-containing protein n=1 Tax=Aspergillus bertholletiae TaxID=1226010 RepID=A0A5N7BIB9_9EURO|nr:heterokaryon incompatibility protein-domain-containing protein [Aspergillus bertholletiae]